MSKLKFPSCKKQIIHLYLLISSFPITHLYSVDGVGPWKHTVQVKIFI